MPGEKYKDKHLKSFLAFQRFSIFYAHQRQNIRFIVYQKINSSGFFLLSKCVIVYKEKSPSMIKNNNVLKMRILEITFSEITLA